MRRRVLARNSVTAVIKKSRNIQSQDEGQLNWRNFGPSPMANTAAGVRPFHQSAIEEALRTGHGSQQCVILHIKTFKII
jgi:hypothetical protein